MDMMEMMDDQDGRDLSSSFSPSASLSPSLLDSPEPMSILPLWHHPDSDSSAV